MNINKKNCIILALATLPMLNSCSDSWLEPKPLSFYSPENTYVDAEGLYAALTACERNMRHEFFGDGAPILTEMYLTDIAIHGKTDESGSLVDLDNEMLPSRTKNDMKGKNKWYWEEGFKGIKYANIAISRLDAAKYKDEAERKAVLGAAYFQRAYRYYKLTHQSATSLIWIGKSLNRNWIFIRTTVGVSWNSARKTWSLLTSGCRKYNRADVPTRTRAVSYL